MDFQKTDSHGRMPPVASACECLFHCGCRAEADKAKIAQLEEERDALYELLVEKTKENYQLWVSRRR